jgi:hypothetical protein
MTGKGEFFNGIPNAHAIFWEYERRFGEICFARQSEHFLIGQALRVEKTQSGLPCKGWRVKTSQYSKA